MEWNNRDKYAAHITFVGDGVPVHHLSDDEFNDLFDQDVPGCFVCDRNRNEGSLSFSIFLRFCSTSSRRAVAQGCPI